jgi:hypothetical protein
MLYTNQIKKINKNLIWPYPTIPEVMHGGGLEALSKNILFPLGKSPMANETFSYRLKAKVSDDYTL